MVFAREAELVHVLLRVVVSLRNLFRGVSSHCIRERVRWTTRFIFHQRFASDGSEGSADARTSAARSLDDLDSSAFRRLF